MDANFSYKTVSCPKCGAREGSRCKTAAGHDVGELYPHIDRVRAFAEKQRRRVSTSSKGVGNYPPTYKTQ
jgi:hypothetical protein